MEFRLPKSFPRAHFSGSGRPRPSRDWLFLLAVAFIALALSIGWNIWTFVRITQGAFGSVEAATTTAPDVSSLEKVRAVFAERAAEEARYKNEYRFVDPRR